MTVCYDPLTNRTVTVSGACPGSTFPMVAGMTPPPQGTETPTQATPGAAQEQAAGAFAQQNIPGAQGLTDATNALSNAANALTALAGKGSGFTNSWIWKQLQDPAFYKQVALVFAGLLLVLIGVPLLFLGGRNRQPTEVVTSA